MKIGQHVQWIEQQYWATKHPDECGYTPRQRAGTVVSFDSETVTVWDGQRIIFLPVSTTFQ
jgi:hypothetical protein